MGIDVSLRTAAHRRRGGATRACPNRTREDETVARTPADLRRFDDVGSCRAAEEAAATPGEADRAVNGDAQGRFRTTLD